MHCQNENGKYAKVWQMFWNLGWSAAPSKLLLKSWASAWAGATRDPFLGPKFTHSE